MEQPFETTYKDLYNEWMSLGEKSLAAAGNARATDSSFIYNRPRNPGTQCKSPLIQSLKDFQKQVAQMIALFTV